MPDDSSSSLGDGASWTLGDFDDAFLVDSAAAAGSTSSAIPKTSDGDNHQRLDQLIATEFSQLSVEERQETLLRMHGVNEKIEETPELLERSLAEFSAEVETFISPVYAAALAENPDYIESSELRLRFLRADLYDSKKAAERFLKFLELKSSAFGPDAVARDIRISDFDKEGRAILESGVFQVLPLKDSAKRVVLVSIAALETVSTVQQRLQLVLYVTHAVSSDVDTQINGAVSVSFMHGEHQETLDIETRKKLMAEGAALFECLPLRVECIHACMENTDDEEMYLSGASKLPKGQARAKLRHHQGTFQECKLHLMTFGIPVDLILFDPENGASLLHHHRWIKMREQVEGAQRPSIVGNNGDASSSDAATAVSNHANHRSLIYSITPDDVLFGRTMLAQTHVGNMRFLKMIHDYLDDYEQAKTKSKFAMGIITSIKSKGGRFLRPVKTSEGCWEETDAAAACEKVCTGEFQNNLNVKQKSV